MFIFMNVLLCKLCGTGRDSHGPGLRTLVFSSAAPSKVHDVNKKTDFRPLLDLPSLSIGVENDDIYLLYSCYEVQVHSFPGYKSGFQMLNAIQLSGIREQEFKTQWVKENYENMYENTFN